MPNYCNFSMKIVGKAGDVQMLCNWLKNDYHYIKKDGEPFFPEAEHAKIEYENDEYRLLTNDIHHFYRVFNFNDEDGLTEMQDGRYYLIGHGDCAWSVYSCMFDGEYTYHKNDEDLHSQHAITLPVACEKLGVWAEVYSYEPGIGFSEHYLISDKGEIIKDEEYTYREITFDDFETKEEAEEAYGRKFTDDEWGHGFLIECEIDPHNPVWHI